MLFFEILLMLETDMRIIYQMVEVRSFEILIVVLIHFHTAFVIFFWEFDCYVRLTLCFWNYSSFKGCYFLLVHSNLKSSFVSFRTVIFSTKLIYSNYFKVIELILIIIFVFLLLLSLELVNHLFFFNFLLIFHYLLKSKVHF